MYKVYLICISVLLLCHTETQAQLSQSREKEWSAVEKEMTLQSRVRALEAQLSGTIQKSQLLGTLKLERANKKKANTGTLINVP